MNLQDYIEHYYLVQNYNCAETILHAANDFYNLGITEDDMKMMGGFGGGMFTGNTCGALIGAAAALSKLLIRNKAHEEIKTIRPAMIALQQNFDDLFSETTCAKIKPVFHSNQTRCLQTVSLAGQALEKTIENLSA